jgi:hypothetical protein
MQYYELVGQSGKKPFILPASVSCQENGRKCASIRGEYLEK